MIMVFTSNINNFYINGLRGIYLFVYILVLVILTLFNFARLNNTYPRLEKSVKNIGVSLAFLISISIFIDQLILKNSFIGTFYTYIHRNYFTQLIGIRSIGIVVVILALTTFIIFNYFYVKRVNEKI